MTTTAKSKTNGLDSLITLLNLTRSLISKMVSLYILPWINRPPISKEMILELPINFSIYSSKNRMPCKRISMMYPALRIIEKFLTPRALIWVQVARISGGLQSMASVQDDLPHDRHVEVLCWSVSEVCWFLVGLGPRPGYHSARPFGQLVSACVSSSKEFKATFP